MSLSWYFGFVGELRVFQLCCRGGSKQQQRSSCFCVYNWVETKSMVGHFSFTTSATASSTASISGTTTSSTIASTITTATDATTTVSTIATTAARLVVGGVQTTTTGPLFWFLPL